MSRIRKVYLDEKELPKKWYNLAADIDVPPYMSPDGPVPPEAWGPVFPMNLVEQGVALQAFHGVLDAHRVSDFVVFDGEVG